MITLRSSSLARAMVCAGSVAFTDLPEQETHEAALEGTACGEVLQYMVENRVFELPDHMTHAKNGYPIDSDMLYYSKEIATDILSRAVTPVSCEGEVQFGPEGKEIQVVGHYDASYWESHCRLAIDDLKYGWGLVENDEKNLNWQLLSYAAGLVSVMGLWGKEDLEVVIRIRQPRPHHEKGPVREVVLNRQQLWDYYNQMIARMVAIADGDKSLVTSPKCKYCPAAAKCPAMNKNFYRALEYVHEFTQDEMTAEELSFQLDTIQRASEIMKIKKDSLEALAIDTIRKGKLIPGYVIDQKMGDRTWKKMITPAVFEAMTGKKIVREEMLSPAQAEKLGISPKFINTLVDRFQKGPKLAKKDTTKLGDAIFGAPQKAGT